MGNQLRCKHCKRLIKRDVDSRTGFSHRDEEYDEMAFHDANTKKGSAEAKKLGIDD